MRSIGNLYQLILGLFYFCSNIVVAEELENYCHDAETNEYWEDLKLCAADNIDIINLANYRKDLCAQVHRGELSVQEATDLFEFERSRVVDKLRRQEELRMLPHENKA